MTDRRSRSRRVVVTLALLCLAPTAGDIGSCGQEAVELDEAKFFREKERIDCLACQSCVLDSPVACAQACDAVVNVVPFPDGCLPLVHDGEVCLNALEAASCDDMAKYLDKDAPTIPFECNFCPPEGRGGGEP